MHPARVCPAKFRAYDAWRGVRAVARRTRGTGHRPTPRIRRCKTESYQMSSITSVVGGAAPIRSVPGPVNKSSRTNSAADADEP